MTVAGRRARAGLVARHAGAIVRSRGVRRGLSIVLEFAPLWLAGVAHAASTNFWEDAIAAMPAGSASQYCLWQAWPTAQLAGSLALLGAAVVAHRAGAVERLCVLAALLGLAVAMLLTAIPEIERLSAALLAAPPKQWLAALDMRFAGALIVGLFAFAGAVRYLRSPARHAIVRPPAPMRADTDNFGHADWLSMDEAHTVFDGSRSPLGGVVIGEAYRVDHDTVAGRRFDPSDRASWGQGGRAPLLMFDLEIDSTHGLVFAGSGGFKTVSVCVPTLLRYGGSAVVLDPSAEIEPIVRQARKLMGHRVVAVDPERPETGFNVLDWIDVRSAGADADIAAVVDWICGERPPATHRGGASASSAFFEGRGKALVEALLSDLIFDRLVTESDRTLKRLAAKLGLPEKEMRAELDRIHKESPSSKARHIAGQLKGLVDETFSGVYGNMGELTAWLANQHFAELVSGSTFRTRELRDGKLDVFLNISLKVIGTTPALARCIVGALLNAVYEAKGVVNGRVLFLLDEVARVGFMSSLARARDAGRKFHITLLMIYQSEGQLTEQWGEAGRDAWFESATWRSYSAIADSRQAERISEACGEYGIVTTARADGSGVSRRQPLQIGTKSKSENETRSEQRRRLVTRDEILQDMRTDEQIVFFRGLKPLRCGRAIYFRRPEMVSAVGQNPYGPASGRSVPDVSSSRARRYSK